MLGEGRMRCQDSALLQCSDRDPSLCSLPAGASGEATAGPGQEADLALSASGASCSAAAWPQTLWGCTSRAGGAPGGSSVPCSICFLFSQHQKKPKKNPWDPQPPPHPSKMQRGSSIWNQNEFPAGHCPGSSGQDPKVPGEGAKLQTQAQQSNRSQEAQLTVQPTQNPLLCPLSLQDPWMCQPCRHTADAGSSAWCP